MVEALAAHVGTCPPGPDGLLFMGSSGQRLRRSAFGETWRRTCEQAEVVGFTMHDLRHFYASLLIRYG